MEVDKLATCLTSRLTYLSTEPLDGVLEMTTSSLAFLASNVCDVEISEALGRIPHHQKSQLAQLSPIFACKGSDCGRSSLKSPRKWRASDRNEETVSTVSAIHVSTRLDYVRVQRGNRSCSSNETKVRLAPSGSVSSSVASAHGSLEVGHSKGRHCDIVVVAPASLCCEREGKAQTCYLAVDEQG